MEWDWKSISKRDIFHSKPLSSFGVYFAPLWFPKFSDSCKLATCDSLSNESIDQFEPEVRMDGDKNTFPNPLLVWTESCNQMGSLLVPNAFLRCYPCIERKHTVATSLSSNLNPSLKITELRMLINPTIGLMRSKGNFLVSSFGHLQYLLMSIPLCVLLGLHWFWLQDNLPLLAYL